MKKILMCIFLIYVLPYTHLFASPPILFFEKKIKKIRRNYTLYKVKKGEHIYSILRKLKLPKTEFGKYIKKIKQLNPDIKDINKLYAGQIIKLPKIHTIRRRCRKCLNGFVIPPSLKDLTIKELKKKYPFYEQKYTVKKGDTLAKLLKIIGKIPNYLIYNEYIFIFKKLNPHIKNINNLPQGVEIIIPSRNPKIKQITEHKKTNSFNNITLCLLKKLGFSIYKKDIIIFPIKRGWIQIDTSKFPILEDTDGKKIILANDVNTYEKYKKIEDSNISVCFIRDLSIYDSLIKIFNYTKRFKIWPKKQNLIITNNFFVAELKGDIQILKYSSLSSTKDISYYIFFLNEKNCTYTENLAYSFLLKNKIFVYFWCNKKSNFISCTDNIDKNIYVPKISVNSNIEALNLSRFLENIKININNSLTLFLPIIKLKMKGNRIIYLFEYNVPELVAILRAKGYNCFTH